MHSAYDLNHIYENIGERIKFLRQVLHLSQKEFANAIGISQSRLSKIEAGEPTKESVLIAISRTFGVSLRWLKTGEGEMFEENMPQTEEEFLRWIVHKVIELFRQKGIKPTTKKVYRVSEYVAKRLMPEWQKALKRRQRIESEILFKALEDGLEFYKQLEEE
ncbi:helix-turn-helix domain-containing protein [Pampinifervens florentissimum]|uniref:helix-turn-helix domain-containing protein n=1 Tax=Pampinifervens florentissimum TaxID=1632019 RepID=UPI0013B48E00|nr:helix-turn-helix domain-containing protein [Hydrogenobacter sp. T-8]QID32297.1 helix-turn-helix domain-containing protein [Hydrogenobacter sp. T-8]